jgi:hypothetical protein
VKKYIRSRRRNPLFLLPFPFFGGCLSYLIVVIFIVEIRMHEANSPRMCSDPLLYPGQSLDGFALMLRLESGGPLLVTSAGPFRELEIENGS